MQDAGHIGQGESFGRQAFFGENAIKTRGGRVTAPADLKPPKRLRLGFVGFGFGCGFSAHCESPLEVFLPTHPAHRASPILSSQHNSDRGCAPILHRGRLTVSKLPRVSGHNLSRNIKNIRTHKNNTNGPYISRQKWYTLSPFLFSPCGRGRLHWLLFTSTYYQVYHLCLVI